MGLLAAIGLAVPGVARAADLYVEAGAGPGGVGTELAPFAEIQQALAVAVAGDVIHVRPGTYAPIATVVDGTAVARIVVRGEPALQAIVQASGTALEAHHEHHTFEGLVFDGGYGDRDAINGDGANGLELLGVEVRRSGRDCIDLRTAQQVLIASSSIHHCVAHNNGALVDAHGVTGDSVFGLELRDTEIYLFSGDAVQMSPPRQPWGDLQIRGCTLWTGALDEDVGPIARGTVIGENALDTKVGPALDGNGARPRVEVVDTVAWGFTDFIGNQAAYNVKEEVDVLLDRVTVYDSELAFRLRGPAQVRVQNAVVHTVQGAVRYEDGLANAEILASTFGGGVVSAFVNGGGAAPVGLVVENLLVLGDTLPGEAEAGLANLAVGPGVFIDATAHDYHLVEGSEPVDAGVELEGVTLDRDGTVRPVGRAFDVGAYEWHMDDPPPPPPGGTDEGGESGGLDESGGDSRGPNDTTDGNGDGTGATDLDPSGGNGSGCGCRSDGTGPGAWALLGLLAGLRRRRRRA